MLTNNNTNSDPSRESEHYKGGLLSSSNPDFNPPAEGSSESLDENILECLDQLGLSNEQNCLVLTPSEHYYYNEEDLRDIRTMVILKQLNHVKNIDKFLHSLFRILQPGANFVGCFSDSDSASGTVHSGKSTGLLNWFINFLDPKSAHRISRKDVYELLESHGFKIIGLKIIGGVTYFYSTNARKEKPGC